MRTPWDAYQQVTATLTEPLDPARDHTLGPADAPVTLLEYGDYQCPYCARAQPVVAGLLQAVGESLLYAFRHFPLTTVHPQAEPAAEAAEAAGAQGQFWPMHDMLFENQHALDDPHLVAYASALGLDTTKFVRDRVERTYAPRVRADFVSGVRSGVNGTPTFFINGIRHDGSYDYPVMLAAIQAAAGVGARR
jgi:protein-disulfide isomerase